MKTMIVVGSLLLLAGCKNGGDVVPPPEIPPFECHVSAVWPAAQYTALDITIVAADVELLGGTEEEKTVLSLRNYNLESYFAGDEHRLPVGAQLGELPPGDYGLQVRVHAADGRISRWSDVVPVVRGE